MKHYMDKIELARKAIHEADFVLVGAGSGLSDEAGLKYSGERFTKNFEPFITKYNFSDLYSSSFYPFKTEEERWAYWAKHISLNRYDTPATELYLNLLKLIRQKEYFVITTNVESQFKKADFDENRIFAMQGDYSLLQCAKGCHSKLYYNENLIASMIKNTKDCRIPSELVPYCPKCGGLMDVNLRKDDSFVEDENWNNAYKRYTSFLKKFAGSKTVLLELGVGFNTPGIIRYPFEKMAFGNKQITLIRINKDHPFGPVENENQTISFNENMSTVINTLRENWNARHMESMARVH